MDVSHSTDWKRLEVSKSRLPCLPDENVRRISRFYKGVHDKTYIILLPIS